LKEFVKNKIFILLEFTNGKLKIKEGESWIKGNETILINKKYEYETGKAEYLECYIFGNTTCTKLMMIQAEEALKLVNQMFKSNYTDMDIFFEDVTEKLNDGKKEIEKYKKIVRDVQIIIDYTTELVWGFINALFLVGCLIGSLLSNRINNKLKRNKTIILNYSITIISSLLVFISSIIESPVCFIISRFLYGLQGGMAIILVPIYLNEISHGSLKSQSNTIPQIFISIGLVISQIIGIKELLGNEKYWNYLLAFPFWPAFLSGISYFLFIYKRSENVLNETQQNESTKSKLYYFIPKS
jgi:hypothetical protein